MDRLVCGDVGFGKTEVALRAAFVIAMSGQQVAVVVPTTLLARQHFRNFFERFQGFPVTVRQLSRFVDAKEAKQTRAELADGKVDIVVGTHALLAKSISFKNLGLVIVDEEQHFGVTHKEQLKSLKADVHVLTLTATPIPRTLQLALSGVRDLSLITTPPIDRLAGAYLRHAVRSAGGARGAAARALSRRPELLCRAAHRRSARGGGIPQGHRARGEGRGRPWPDVGLGAGGSDDRVLRAQGRCADLHQHRRERSRHPDRQHHDRAPRRHVRPVAALSAARAHRPRQAARLCVSDDAGRPEADRHGGAAARSAAIARPARRRVLGREPRHGHSRRRQSLGRGQSGHVREVGIELYQEMLEDAVSQMRLGEGAAEIADQWSPTINIAPPCSFPNPMSPTSMSAWRCTAGSRPSRAARTSTASPPS